MKEKVFFVCASEDWSVKERTVVKDMLVSKQQGREVYLFALKDSFLDMKATSFGIPVVHFFGKLNTNILKWKRLTILKQQINKLNIDIVHCYNDNLVWPLAFFLRRKPYIPLILSSFNRIKKGHKSLIYRTLSGRIDLVINYYKVHQNNIIEKLGIPALKVKHEDFPINSDISVKLTRQRFLKQMGVEDEADIFLIGAFVDVNLKSIDSLKPVLKAISVLSKNTNKNFRLILFNEKNWGNSLIYPELLQEIKNLSIEDEIVFYKASSNLKMENENREGQSYVVPYIEDIMPVLDLWMNTNAQDNMDDLTIASLIQGLPIIGHRSAAMKEFLYNYPECGESYKFEDARELKDKVLKILENEKVYRKNIKKVIDELEVRGNFKDYSFRLSDLYMSALRKRQRFYAKKK